MALIIKVFFSFNNLDYLFRLSKTEGIKVNVKIKKDFWMTDGEIDFKFVSVIS